MMHLRRTLGSWFQVEPSSASFDMDGGHLHHSKKSNSYAQQQQMAQVQLHRQQMHIQQLQRDIIAANAKQREMRRNDLTPSR